MKKQLLASLGASMLAVSGAANAAFLLDDWTLDVTGVDGLVAGDVLGQPHTVVSGISQMSFLAQGLSVTNDTNGDGLPSVGETFDVFANGRISDFVDNGGSSVSPILLNSTASSGAQNGWEMTFTFEVSGAYTALNPGSAEFTHLAAGMAGTTGELKFYIDDITDGSKSALSAASPQADDGTHIATFLIKAGDGGVFSFLTGDGSDDARFELDWALPGVFLDKDGDSLTADGTLIGMSDSNFDSDPDGTGSPFSLNIGAFNCGNTATNFCFEEDGSFRIPEPGILALLGAGILGLTLTSRRRKSA